MIRLPTVFAEQLLRIGVDPLQLPVLVLDDYQRAPHALSWVYYAPRIGSANGDNMAGNGNGTDGSGTEHCDAASISSSSSPPSSSSSTSTSSASASAAVSPQCALARTPSWHADRLHRPDLLRHFLTRALIGAERPFAKSAPVPSDQIGPMLEVVGDTFQVRWRFAGFCVLCVYVGNFSRMNSSRDE
jgi:hypothetical protein